MMASEYGHVAIVQSLLKADAFVNAQNKVSMPSSLDCLTLPIIHFLKRRRTFIHVYLYGYQL